MRLPVQNCEEPYIFRIHFVHKGMKRFYYPYKHITLILSFERHEGFTTTRTTVWNV